MTTATSEQGWQLSIAIDPWFGWCRGTCDRELGWDFKSHRPNLELVARRIGDSTPGFFRAECVREVVRLEEIRAYEEEQNYERTTR